MRVFVSPLDWGLGHAARCVPLVKYLFEKNIEVIIGAEGSHLLFLKEHFPTIEYVEFPGYQISYSDILPVNIKVLLQFPNITSAIHAEHKLLNQLIEQKEINVVISDNRYGLWSEKIPSVIITHQLNVQVSAGKSLFNKIIHNHLHHFDECWIPDYAGKENLSGALSHPTPKGVEATYIGPLSRFDFLTNSDKKQQYDLFIILSGPEPQRSALENIILKQLKELSHIKALILQGLPGRKSSQSGLENVKIVSHLSDKEFEDKIHSSEIILSRPGYSTIMDLYAIGWKKAIFIPTPGQNEQEYLGKLFQDKGLAVTCNQKGFSLKDAVAKAKKLNPVQRVYSQETYKSIIDNWLKKIGLS